MSITVSGRIEFKAGYNGSVATYNLGSIPAVNIGTDPSVSLEVYGTVTGLNSLSSYLNVDSVTTRPGGTPRPSTDYDSVRTIWSGAVFPRDAIPILSAMEQVGASIGDINFATGESTTSIRRKLELIAPPLKWSMTVSPAATIWIGPLTYSSANDRSADSPLLNGCNVHFPDKSAPTNYQLSITLYDGVTGTVYGTGGIAITREPTFTPGLSGVGGGIVTDSGKTYTPAGYFKFIPTDDNTTSGTLSNGSVRIVPSTYTGVGVRWDLSTAVAGPVTPYSEFRITSITPATGQSVPTDWTSSATYLTLSGLTTTETTYNVDIRYWDTDPRLIGGSISSTPASANATASFKFKNEIATSVAVTPSNTLVNKNSSVTFTVSTTGYADGTSLTWVIDGNVKTNDFTDNQLTGTVTVQSNEATISKTLSSTISPDSYFTLKLKLNDAGSVLATSSQITISPHVVTTDLTSVDEDGTVTFTVTTENINDGDTLYWTTQGTVNSADFIDNKLSGTIVINSNSATIVRQLVEDVRKEGAENFKIEIRTESLTGTVIARSDVVTINDTSAPAPSADYTGTEVYNPAAPNGPTNPQYFDVSNLRFVATPLTKIQDEVKSIDEKFGTSNSYLSRIADSLESIAGSLKGIESHQKTMKDLAEGKGINTTSPYEWFNMITTYRLLIEEGDVLKEIEEVSDAEQQKALEEVTKYVGIINKLPTGIKK